MKTSTSRSLDQPLMEMFLRIKHPTMDPDAITETLGLEPEECIKMGASASTSGGRRLHSESYWIAGLTVPSMAELGRWEVDAPEVRLAGGFPQSGERVAIKHLLGATEYDFYILSWLRRLEGKQVFFSELIQAGGSATLLIQRNDQNAPVSLRKSLGLLETLGIGLEID
jgi:hypothetical protein